MNVLEIGRTALQSLSSNKLRSALTTLGIVIGVASLIAMLALGNGTRAAVNERFRTLGSDVVAVHPLLQRVQGQDVPKNKPLTYGDGLEMPDQVPLVARVSMSLFGFAKVRQGRNVLDMGVSGVSIDGLKSLMREGRVLPAGLPAGVEPSPQDFIAQGRFFTPGEIATEARAAVLGHGTAEDLFGLDDPIDQTIWIARQRFVVIGVLAALESTESERSVSYDPDVRLMIPVSTATRALFGDQNISVSMEVHVRDEARVDEAKTQIATFLRQQHNIQEGEDDDFYLVTRKDVLGAQQEAARALALLLAAMAAVSLIVGGIGIMNVMLVSVTERTREIGIRRAVGATRADIVRQFLAEATLLSLSGGGGGVVVGVLAIPLAAQLNRGLALLVPGSIPLAFGFATLTGVIFGLYPALRAARLDPIQALRYE